MVTQIELGDITVDVVLKDIKNIHLSVYPPSGRVRISAPSRMSHDTIRIFTIAYGRDAKQDILRNIAEATQAKSYEGNPKNIVDVFRDISTFF